MGNINGTPVAAGSNRDFAHTVSAEAPRSRVWSLWTEVPNWPKWDTELRDARLDAPGKFEVGATGVLTPKVGPSSRFVITEVSPDDSGYVFETKLPLGILRVQRFFEPDESCRFTHRVTFSGVSAFLFAAILGKRFRKVLPVVMRQLADFANSVDA